VQLAVSDLGFVIHTSAQPLSWEKIQDLLAEENLEADVIEGLDRGTLIASRFQHTASTGFMVLKNVEGGKVRVGGQDWVSRRLYPVVAETCPTHPLLREARRETLEDILDLPSASLWLCSRPKPRLRMLKRASPFTQAWIEPFGSDTAEPIQYESADDALKRLHERLFAVAEKAV
jgi:ATP-dependent Lhr-like helicase